MAFSPLNAPQNRLGSPFRSNTYSPGSAQKSTTLPWSTISMHWPSATAITEPSVMTLSSSVRLPPKRLFVFFIARAASTLSGSAST